MQLKRVNDDIMIKKLKLKNNYDTVMKEKNILCVKTLTSR